MAKSDKKRLVILDTHAILHRAYHALPDFSSSKGEPTGALYGLITMLLKTVKDLKPDYIVAAFDLPGPTFRKAAYKDYKGTRVKTEDALVMQIKRSREVLRALGIPMYDAKGFEADDVVGTIVEKTKKQKDLGVIIASGDADTLQLIDDKRVQVFTMRKGLNDTVIYDEEAVKTRFGFGPECVPDLKGIAGDVSDNIKGVPGVGEGSALKLLQTYGSLEAIYKAIKKDGVEVVAEKADVQKRFVQLVSDHKEEAEFSKLLATIRRDAPIDFELPKSTWLESVDAQVAVDMLQEFEFRSLVPRVKELLGSTKEMFALEEERVKEEVDEEEFAKIALAVSVLNSDIAQPTLDDIYQLGRSDKFEEAKKNILGEIKEKDLTFVYEKMELPLMPVLRRMERDGVLIDKKFLKELSKKYHGELNKIATRIYKHAGMEFNINSPRQLGEILFDKLGLTAKNQKKTAGGQRSTRESELQKLKDLHPIVDDILAHRELAKLLGTYIDTIPTLLDGNDRLHTTFIQIGAATGRMATQNPGLQNIPIKTDLGRVIREAFIAPKGHSIVAFDYSQIELRIAAFITGDEGLSDIFKKGRDVHNEVAAKVFGVKESEVTPEMRRRAKVINFGILYGMGVGSLQQSLGTSRAEAQKFYNDYFTAFPKLATYMEEVVADATRKGYTQTHFGRRRYLEAIKSPIPYVKAGAERMAINAPIQGTQADLVKLAMIEIDEMLEKENVRDKVKMLLQVHDELVFEVEDSVVKKMTPKIKKIMEEVVGEKDRKGIPFIAEGKVGPNWGDTKKI